MLGITIFCLVNLLWVAVLLPNIFRVDANFFKIEFSWKLQKQLFLYCLNKCLEIKLYQNQWYSLNEIYINNVTNNIYV